MEYTRYGFENCIGAFFEMPTENARKILPPHLQPLELQHTRSILAMNAFAFTESEVGEYDEIVLAIVVPPLVERDRPMAKSAFYPFIVGTSTEASREHAIERWHLPHYMQEVQLDWDVDDDAVSLSVREGDAPVLDVRVTDYEAAPAKDLYHAFMKDDEGRFKANIYMEAPHSEHEEERGSLTLHEHPMIEPLSIPDVNTFPFREQWYRAGVQTFEPLETI